MARLRKAAMFAPALVLAGCGSVFPHRQGVPPPPPPPPVGYQIAPSGAVVAPPGARAAAVQGPAPVRVAASHRQYFDQRRHRYYYYDPARRAYFWEDGTPKT